MLRNMGQHRVSFVPFMFLLARAGTAGQRGPEQCGCGGPRLPSERGLDSLRRVKFFLPDSGFSRAVRLRQRADCRSVEHAAVRLELRTVAGAIPAFFEAIPVNDAAD